MNELPKKGITKPKLFLGEKSGQSRPNSVSNGKQQRVISLFNIKSNIARLVK